MVLDADTYGTIKRVEALVGDVAEGLVFTLTSKPTLSQTEKFLDDTASELNSALTFSEYEVPVVLATDKAAFNFLAYANSCGAAVLVLSALPAEAYTEPGEETPAQGRKQFCETVFKRALKGAKDREVPATKVSGGSLLSDLKIGSETNSDGDTKKPIFTRATSDFPSSRSLTET